MAKTEENRRSLSARAGAGRFFAGAVRFFSYCFFYFTFIFFGKTSPQALPNPVFA